LFFEHDLARKPVITFRDHACSLSMILPEKSVATFRDHALIATLTRFGAAWQQGESII
jgi:hypothetical protein